METMRKKGLCIWRWHRKWHIYNCMKGLIQFFPPPLLHFIFIVLECFFFYLHIFFFASKCWYRRTEEQVCTFLHVVSNDWQHVIWLSCDHILRMSYLLLYCIGYCRPLQKFIMQHFSVVFLPWPTSALPEEHWRYSEILWWEESVFFTGMVM